MIDSPVLEPSSKQGTLLVKLSLTVYSLCDTWPVNSKEEVSKDTFVRKSPLSLFSPKAGTVSICHFKLAHVLRLLYTFPGGILRKDFCILWRKRFQLSLYKLLEPRKEIMTANRVNRHQNWRTETYKNMFCHKQSQNRPFSWVIGQNE